MSISNERAEELIYGHLDDALSESDLAEFLRYRASDRDFATLLTQLRRRRETLQQIAIDDAATKLDDGFAERVVQAAVERAREEGLADDHPLNRVAEQPFVTTGNSNTKFWNLRNVAIAASIAASFVLAVGSLGWVPGIGKDDQTPTVAQHSPVAETTTQENSLRPADAVTDHDADRKDDGIDQETDRSRTTDQSVNADATSRPMALATVPAQTSQSNVPQTVIVEPTSDPKVTDSLAGVSDQWKAEQWKVPAILVLDVRQTEQGRQTQSVRQALEAVQITHHQQRAVTEPLAAAATASAEVNDSEYGSVLFLVAPGKNLDRLYLRLCSDEQGIESVSMSLSMDGPVLEAVSKVTVDPTTVRHGSSQLGSVVDLAGEDAGNIDQLVEVIDRLHFSQITGNTAGMHSQAGPDIVVPILMVVR